MLYNIIKVVRSGAKWLVFHILHKLFHRKGGNGMFLGEYKYLIDAKNRLFIPAKFREALGEKFVVTRGVDRCLSVYPQDEWQKYTDKINSLPPAQARRIRRFLYAGASELEVDSHGRTVVPSNLLEYAGISGDVYITGMGSYIEIWSAAAWQDERKLESSDDIAELMETLGC